MLENGWINDFTHLRDTIKDKPVLLSAIPAAVEEGGARLLANGRVPEFLRLRKAVELAPEQAAALLPAIEKGSALMPENGKMFAFGQLREAVKNIPTQKEALANGVKTAAWELLKNDAMEALVNLRESIKNTPYLVASFTPSLVKFAAEKMLQDSSVHNFLRLTEAVKNAPEQASAIAFITKDMTTVSVSADEMQNDDNSLTVLFLPAAKDTINPVLCEAGQNKGTPSEIQKLWLQKASKNGTDSTSAIGELVIQVFDPFRMYSSPFF